MTDNERRIYLLRIRGLEEDIDSYRDIDKNNLLEIERLRKLVLDKDALELYEIIELRLHEDNYDTLKIAADIANRTIADFILDAAFERAADLLKGEGYLNDD